MSEKINWSFTVGASSGAGLNLSGSVEAEAATSAIVTLEANMASQMDLQLQLAAVDKVVFLAIFSSLQDGSVEVQADGAAATPLTGPLILYGDAVALFASDLTTLKTQNKHATDQSELSVLIGRNLSS